MVNLWPAELQLKSTLESQWKRFVRVYHNEDSLKKARETIPFVQLTIEAQKKHRNSSGTQRKLSIKEYLFLELLRWFKLRFFKWVDALCCSSCGSKTANRGALTPTPEELRYGANRVENHFCTKCKLSNRFPRYNCPVKLLETRRGRCGEWANCFVLCSRALGFETRYVFDETDHVWCEIFSDALGSRWVHADPCENCFDTPLLYEKGWKKKLTHIFAFSSNQVIDVSWRYSQKHDELLQRRGKYRESVVFQLICLLNEQIRLTMPDSEWALISRRSITEGVEFINNDSKLNLKLTRSGDHAQYTGRTTGSVEWRQQRGELGDQQACSSDGNKHNDFIFDMLPVDEESEHGTAKIVYCPVEDEYVFENCNGEISRFASWQTAVYSYANIYRKEEFDWKMVYLARDPENNDSPGWIEWKFRVPSHFKISRLKLHFSCKLYENAAVDLRIVDSTSKPEQRFQSLHSIQMNGHEADISSWNSQAITLRAQLSGGQGDVAWQHAQLFRQSLEHPKQYPLNIIINFSKICT